MNKYLYLVAMTALSFPLQSLARTVHYDLLVEQKSVNLSEKKSVDFALTVNGGIPAPTLEFTEGDDAEITVTNQIPSGEDVSIHWHGILLPPLEDGVPFVNTPPIYKGKSRTFKFKIRQNGTYWYHSHTMLQEQKGVYGAIVIHPKKDTIKVDKEVVAVISDWSDEDADQILRNLKKEGDYYLYKKGTIRSYGEAIQKGRLGNQLMNEWNRMAGMDLSDVGYDAFFINGKKDSQLITAKPGERIRVRIINAAASTYFHISLGGLPMQVISADGVDVAPIMANELFMGMAETYDVLFTVPNHKNYELRVTAQDGTGLASGWIGMNEKVSTKDVPAPDMYATMDHDMSGMDHSKMKATEESKSMDMKGMDHSMQMKKPTANVPTKTSVIESLKVDDLKALKATALPKNSKVHDLKLVLNGDMRRYVWHINGKTIAEDRLLTVHPGEVIRITYQNDSMMHHPMHLHGHFFRVVNKNGEYSPMKHTVDVPPMSSRTIEFYTDEVGQWMLHCHNLLHMASGMARVVKYSNFIPSPEMAMFEKHDHHQGDPWYSYGKFELSSNHAKGNYRISQSWNEFQARIESANIRGKNFSLDDKWDYEGDFFYRRWLSNWTNLIAGGTSYGEKFHGVIGVGQFLPLMFETNIFVNHEGQFRLDVNRKFQWTKTVRSELELTWRPGNQRGEDEVEVETSLMYSPTWTWAAGLMVTNDSVGGGIEYQF